MKTIKSSTMPELVGMVFDLDNGRISMQDVETRIEIGEIFKRGPRKVETRITVDGWDMGYHVILLEQDPLEVEATTTLRRAGLRVEGGQIKFITGAPVPIDEDVSRQYPDSADYFWHFLPEVPWRLGRFLVWREKKHLCCGGTYTTYHCLVTNEVVESGGALPRAVCESFDKLSPEEVYRLTPEAAVEEITQDWVSKMRVLEDVLSGTLGLQWAPKGETSISALYRSVSESPLKGEDILQLVRAAKPRPEWEVSPVAVEETPKGWWPTYGDGDVIYSIPLKRGGWLVARAPVGSEQNNNWC